MYTWDFGDGTVITAARTGTHLISIDNETFFMAMYI